MIFEDENGRLVDEAELVDTPMSMPDEELRKLCEAATPGPWVKAGDGEVTGGDGDDSICIVLERYDVDDAAFIAAAREAIPRLLAEKERLLDIIAAARGALDGRPGAIAELDRATRAYIGLEQGGE